VLPLFGAEGAIKTREERPAEPDPRLVRAVDTIRNTFRTLRSDRIRPLLPLRGKVFLAVRDIAEEPSFYSSDQILLLLRQAFAGRATIFFRIQADRATEGRAEPTVTICSAAWSFRDLGTRREIRLRIVLANRPRGWVLSELREIR
jgi:hypothetical protein